MGQSHKSESPDGNPPWMFFVLPLSRNGWKLIISLDYPTIPFISNFNRLEIILPEIQTHNRMMQVYSNIQLRFSWACLFLLKNPGMSFP